VIDKGILTPAGGYPGDVVIHTLEIKKEHVTGREHFLVRAGQLANVVLASAAGLALLVLTYFVYGALSGQRRFSSWGEIVLYDLLPSAVAVLLFLSLRLEPIPKLRLLTSGVAVVASVYLAELFLVFAGGNQITAFNALDYQTQLRPEMVRLANARNKEKYAAALTKQFGNPIDLRTAREVIADLRKNGVDAIPIMTASNHFFVRQPDGSIHSAIKIDGREVIPLGTVSRRTTLLCNENGQWIDYRSDSRGFNNPDGAWEAQPLDIGALGDSFTQGYCVPGGRSFVDLIRQRDRATLNLGIAGEGPLMMLATLKEYLPRLAPKVVLWFYYEGNDLVDLQTERRSALLRSYLRDDFSQHDLARQSDLDRAMTAEIPRLATEERENVERRTQNMIVYGLIAAAKLTALRSRLVQFNASDPEAIQLAADFETPNMEVFREVLTQAKTHVEAWNGQLFFVYLPEWTRYTSYGSWGKTKRPEVLAMARGLGLSIIDIDPVFQAHGDPLSLFPFRASGHYAEAGHRLVADEVVRELRSRHLLPDP
jgi:hypothetical protein